MADSKLSRRRFIQGSAAATAGIASAGIMTESGAADETASQPATNPDDPARITLTINGETRTLSVDTRSSLLNVLREHLGLTGTKVGCNHGQCGACTVLLDGKRVNACLTLAVMADGHEVTTIEGLADSGELHPMQEAFVEQDAFQCGYCTPGQIVSAVGCVKEGHAGSAAEIREYMSGNLCRCGAYTNIVAAVQSAAEKMRS
jgi:xanthine dehydrogenase YagT iron-sulfur-binding subunit